jgi:hypothetical protein
MMKSPTVGMVVLRIVLLAIVGRLVVVSSSRYYRSKGWSGVPTIPPLTGGATSTVRDLNDVSEQGSDHNNINDNMGGNGDSWNVSSSSSDDNLSTTTTTTTTTKAKAMKDDHNGMGETEGNHESKRRKMFLNRIAKVSSLLLRREQDAVLENEKDELEMHHLEWGMEVTPQSDLTRPGRYVHIVTTASLPWFTGTAVNPLLRAAYLHQRLQTINKNQTNMTTNKSSYVTLIIPWLELPEDQEKLYNGIIFKTPMEQEEYVREWLRNQAGMPDAADNLNLHFYNARYHAGLGSVFAMGDIIQQLPQDQLDVCVLEEPEQ